MTGLVGVTLVVVSLLGAGAEDAEERRAECVMWSHLENKTMPLQDQGHATCRTNEECSGFTCEGQFKVSMNYEHIPCETLTVSSPRTARSCSGCASSTARSRLASSCSVTPRSSTPTTSHTCSNTDQGEAELVLMPQV